MYYHHFTDSERSELEILLSKGYSQRSIANTLQRSQSNVSREIQRNSVHGVYIAVKAKHKAYVSRHYSKYQGMKIQNHKVIRYFIISKLLHLWTPEMIAGHLQYEQTLLPTVSTKAIYKWLYSAYGQRYCSLLPKQRVRPKRRKGKKTKREMIPNRIGIERRPDTANLRKEIGHLETDTVVSGKKTGSKAALTILEDRTSRRTKIKKIHNMRPVTNRIALTGMVEDLYCLTITHDNGIENKQHERMAIALDIDTYFCDPYSSWQKGSIENTIGRIRRFIPKGSDVNLYSDAYIQMIEDWLNNTPRKCLDFKTPNEVYFTHLLSNSSSSSDALEG